MGTEVSEKFFQRFNYIIFFRAGQYTVHIQNSFKILNHKDNQKTMNRVTVILEVTLSLTYSCGLRG